VLIGEVWVGSSQSNMEWSAKLGLAQAAADAPLANHPQIRLFNVAKSTAKFPQDDCVGAWTICSPDTMRPFSAVAYYFGRKLHAELNVPIGLVASSWGRTPAEVWTPQTVFSDPV
jgi:sialate O-acetylesterase